MGVRNDWILDTVWYALCEGWWIVAASATNSNTGDTVVSTRYYQSERWLDRLPGSWTEEELMAAVEVYEGRESL